MPWIDFPAGEYGPYTRAFVGVVRITPAGEKIILPKDRYGNSGGLRVCNVALYELNQPSIMATLVELFPSDRVDPWALQQDSLCAVMLARHFDGNEFWAAVCNLNTQRICYPLATTGLETIGNIGDMFMPKLGLGGLLKGRGAGDQKQWREDIERFSGPAAGLVVGFIQNTMLSGGNSGKL